MEFKRQRAEMYIRMTLAVAYSEFLRDGEKWLGKEGFERRVAAIDEHQPKVEMIIAGFIEGPPLLFRIGTFGPVNHIDIEAASNSYMIGTGATAASITLHGREHDHNTPYPRPCTTSTKRRKRARSAPVSGRKRACTFCFRLKLNR